MQLEVIPGITDQERKNWTPESDKEDQFLWPDNDNSAQKIADEQHDLVFNNLFSTTNISMIGHKSSKRKISTVINIFNRIYKNIQDKIYLIL